MASVEKPKTANGAVPVVLQLRRVYVIPSDIAKLYGEILGTQRSIGRHYSEIRNHYGIPRGKRPTVWQLSEYEGIPLELLVHSLGLVVTPK